MPKVTFRNILDETSEFIQIDKEYLVGAIYEYARVSDEDIYKTIMHKRIVIFLNNENVPVDNWHNTTLNKDDEVIVVPELEGKLGGFLQIVAGALLMAFAGPVGLALSVGKATVFAIGVSMALGGLSSLMFAPDLPSSSSIEGARSTQTYNWSGIKSMAKADTPVPVIYGTHPVGGNVISLFTDTSGDDSYLNMLIALGEGEIEGICEEFNHTSVCTTSDPEDPLYKSPAITLDDQPLRFYEDVEWWYRKGTNLPDSTKSVYNPDYQNIIPNFDSIKVQYDDGREVPASPDYIEYITTKPVDMAVLQFYVPQLFNAAGRDFEEQEIRFKIFYSTDGVDYYNAGGIMTNVYEPLVTWAGTGGDRSQYCECNSYVNSKFRYLPLPTITIKVLRSTYFKKCEKINEEEYCYENITCTLDV